MFGRWGRAIIGERTPKIDLDQLIACFGGAVSHWAGQPISDVLMRAYFADICRDADVRPVEPARFEDFWGKLETEDQERFAVYMTAREFEPVVKALGLRCQKSVDAAPVLDVLEQLCTELKLLTPRVLQESDIRLEELARHFCAAWQLRIEGEAQAQSGQRLHEIDFDRLMREAEAARSSADERLAYVRKLQEEQEESRRPRRGKW